MVIVFREGLDLVFRFVHALLNNLFRFRSSAADARKQGFVIRGKNVDHDRLGHFFFDLERALDFNIENDILSCGECVLDGFSGCAVVVSDVLRVFEHFALFDLVFKIGFVHEIIMNAVLFSGSGRAGRCGNGEIKGCKLAKAAYDRALSASCGTGDDNE